MNSSALEYPFADYPSPAVAREIAPGVRWLSTPLPFRLRAVNVYLIEDDDGWTIVDCGYSRDDVRALWEQVFATALGGKPVTRVVVTHYHPDHVGNSAWLCERWQLLPLMTRAERLSAQLALSSADEKTIDGLAAFYAANGVPADAIDVFRSGVVPYRMGVRLTPAFRRIVDGEVLTIGGRRWQVIVGQGHSPEHASLYCGELGVLIAGDQLLPEITTNVSVWPSEPEADPLALFLASLSRFEEVLRPDTLVLPAHRRPFRGVGARVAELREHHRERLQLVLELAAQSRHGITAGNLLPHLFPPGLDGHQIMFAVGEAIAHLNFLVERGRLRRDEVAGVMRFNATGRQGGDLLA
jgi:glyoxylase-like metal-dependent hydrolase (beta-lactamase superfamily II)